MEEIDTFTALVLGIVEGITEFLPISSTGHLILASSFLGMHGEKVKTFEIFIQAGAILAVVLLFWRRFVGFLQIKKSPQIEWRSFAGIAGIVKLGICCGPIFVFGALFGSKIKAHLFSPSIVAAAFIAGAILMLIFERRREPTKVFALEEVSIRQCLGIGLVQCLALWPGFSRSASTIIGGMVCGLERRVAAELSFLVAVPVLCAAVILDVAESYALLSATDLEPFAIGFVVSFLTALVAVKGFILMLGRISLLPFAIYRIIAGVLVLTVWANYFTA